MAFPENIFVPIGVVSAALIAGSIAYAGLITTKESKVSEFRQAWINELREEIATYISRVDALIEHVSRDNAGKFMPPTLQMRVKLDHSELYSEMLKSRISIMLRINDKEVKKEDFNRNDIFLKLIESIYKNFEEHQFSDVYEDIKRLTDASRSLLKHEWNRARDGEKRFQSAKDWSKRGMRWATTLLLALVFAAAYEAIFSPSVPPAAITTCAAAHTQPRLEQPKILVASPARLYFTSPTPHQPSPLAPPVQP
jgi:hypothetical protein